VANIAQHQSATTTKLLLIGHSGSGKTGALAALAAAGYKLRILDFDNGLDILRNYLTDPQSPYVRANPKCADNVDFVTCTDKMRNVAGNIMCAKAEAWQRATSMLVHWKYGEGASAVDLGKITDWGSDTILVVDSLSMAATAALNFHLQMNGKLGQARTQNEARRDIGATQGHLRKMLELLYDDSIKCNTIVNSHITMVTESGLGPQSEEFKEGGGNGEAPKGFPSAIGRALSPIIPRFFNNVLFVDTAGSGMSAKHKIYTKSQGAILVKSTAPLRVKAEYEIANGLAEFFAAVRDKPVPS
jgi:hypothetical protein